MPLSATGDGSQRLTWGLCVATLNRIDTLECCVRCALAQTRPPAEITIVDASDTWEDHKSRIADLVKGADVHLHYLGHEKKSSAAQRNHGLRTMTADIAFVIDDDSLLQPTCAEVIMGIYERDTEKAIAGISATNVGGEVSDSAPLERKNAGGLRQQRWTKAALRNSALARWVLKEILMQSRDRIFVKYDDAASHCGREEAPLDIPRVRYTEFLPGWGMTVRREIAVREPFDDGLLAYCPTEDLDASYRYGRHGVNLVAADAHIHHVEVAAGRIKRKKVTTLSVMNSAYFTRRNSTRVVRHATRYYFFAVRRVFAEFLKDLLSGRLTFPQLRGAAAGIARSPAIFLRQKDGLAGWYELYQMEVLAN